MKICKICGKNPPPSPFSPHSLSPPLPASSPPPQVQRSLRDCSPREICDRSAEQRPLVDMRGAWAWILRLWKVALLKLASIARMGRVA